jgi:hypothetical protein
VLLVLFSSSFVMLKSDKKSESVGSNSILKPSFVSVFQIYTNSPSLMTEPF